MNSNDESDTAKPFVDNTNNPDLLNYQDNNARNHDTTPSDSYRSNYLEETDTHCKISVAHSLQSLDALDPPSTPPEENTRLTRLYLSLVMSIIYAILLVTVGIIASVGASYSNVSMIYAISLCGIGFVYLVFLMIDIGRYKCIALKNQQIKESFEEKCGLISIESPGEDASEFIRSSALPKYIPFNHQYCFSKGRHAEIFYLKLGAAGFAIGHLVHSIFQIVVQLGFIFDEDIDNNDCINLFSTALDFMLPCYCFLQLYFIFKYSNVIILKSKPLAYFALMHMIGSSLFFWTLAIARETTLILTIYAYFINFNINNGTQKHEYDEELITEKLGSFINIQELYRENCTGSEAINTILVNVSPYLYPFNVEFNILIVAVFYIIWSNIGNCENVNRGLKPNSTHDGTPCRLSNGSDDEVANSNMVIHADCSASFRGLFAGIILLVFVIGMLILGFVLGNAGGTFQKVGYLLKDVFKLAMHSLMLIAAMVAFTKLRKLDINKHSMSSLDDVLLYICLPAFFMETVLSMIATVNIVNVLKSIDVIVMVLQVVIQTPLIMDGLRRCSNSKKLRRSKPGRELLMFLLIANVTMWLFNTFSYKSPESFDERYEYYGKALWTVLGHISLPLMMFYRFHSSVCLADIWDSAYKPGSEH